MKLHCINCGKETELNKVYNDDLGYYRVCPECEASHDIDDETALEFEKQLYEPMVKKALKDGWPPRSVCCAIYGIFQDYGFDEECENYLYEIADPDNVAKKDEDFESPAEDWFGYYPAPNLIEQYGKEVAV